MSEEKQVKIYYDARSVTLRTTQVVQFVQDHDKLNMLALTLKEKGTCQTTVLTKSKKIADAITNSLSQLNLKAQAIHGNHTKETQETRAKNFNQGETNIIVTTDAIFETLELSDIKLVISYDLPASPEDYFRRVASTKELGESISFVSPDDERFLALIEHNIKAEIQEATLDGFVPTPSTKQKSNTKRKKPRHKKTKPRKDSQDEEI